MDNKDKRILTIVAFLFLVIVVAFFIKLFTDLPDEVVVEDSKDVQIEQIMLEEDFQKRAREEAEIIYYKRQIEEAKARLLELEASGFLSNSERAAVLSSFLIDKGAVELAAIAPEIVKMDRWIDVVAIAGHETGFCRSGVGASKNNCGGIRGGDGFAAYGSKADGMQAISTLITNERYAGLSLAQMNGVYCVDEVVGGACDHWTEAVEGTVNNLATLVVNSMLE